MAQPADVLKQIFRTWLQERHQALLEQVMMTWEEGLGRLTPDDALAQQILDAMPAPAVQTPPATAAVSTDPELGVALDQLENASSQAEVLNKLLDGMRPFADRSALFILKQGLASLYASRGFVGKDGTVAKVGASVAPPPELEALIVGQFSVIQQAGEAYQALVQPLSALRSTDIRIHPIRLKRKVVAVLLADSGLRPTLDYPSHIRALARGAEAVLAYMSGAKDDDKPGTGPLRATGSMPVTMPVPAAALPPAVAPPRPAAPSMPSMPTMPESRPTPAYSAPTVSVPMPTPAHSAPTMSVPMLPPPRPAAPPPPALHPPPEPLPAASDLDPKIRSTAERLARVLVGDIELYFPQKVAQGRQQGNLYALLRDELERSRATFIDRFGEGVESQHRIFIQTVHSQLCEGLPSKLGTAPWA